MNSYLAESRITVPVGARLHIGMQYPDLVQGESYKIERITCVLLGSFLRSLPCSLIFTVSTLHDLVFAGQYLLLENLGSASFVHACDFQDLSRVHVGVIPSTHYCNATNHTFVDLYYDATVSDNDFTRKSKLIRNLD